MAFFDLPPEALQTYCPVRSEPADFDAFWERSLAETRQHALEARFAPYADALATVECYDVIFRGYGGQHIKGWLNLPRQREGRLPCVVEFVGYGGGRGFPIDWLIWSAAGYANLIMDTRGQGSVWLNGDTPDLEPEGSNGHYPGFLTRGILRPESYYYRRVFCDAVRAVEAAASHPAVDAERIAAAALSPLVKLAMPEVPFLCAFRRASEITDAHPYKELAEYLNCHRDQVERALATLAYFDGVNLAARARAKALFVVGLMDEICPPSTVYAAYNHWAGEKSIILYRYMHHESGGFQKLELIRFLREQWG